MAHLLPKNRIQSIDLLRGMVMVFMALDHCRDFVHIGNYMNQDPLDFETTTPFLFLTRWITHFCAPVFVFLAGTSVSFMSRRKTPRELSWFLFTRGLWLIVMELTLVNWGWAGSLSYNFVAFQVIWAIGISMVMLSGLLYLPSTILLGLGLLIVFGHNLFDRFDNLAELDFPGGFPWALVHHPRIFEISPHFTFAVFYPFMPWLGLMICGYQLGRFYKPEVAPADRRNQLLWMGIGAVFLFVMLRSGNFYGDYAHWEKQKTPVFTALSFVNTTKYPPSLLYVLMTIGPALVFLALSEGAKNQLFRWLMVFGRVPFFYYLLHLYLFHSFALVLFFATGNSAQNLDSVNLGGFPNGFGLSLGWTYLVWLVGIVLLYFPCRWYDRYKSAHPEKWWLSYL